MADGIYILPEADRRKFAKIITSVWADEQFKARWESEPYAVLAEHDIDYPSNVAPPPVPPRPDNDVTVEALEALSAGDCFGTAGTASSISSTFSCLGTYGSLSPAEPTAG